MGPSLYNPSSDCVVLVGDFLEALLSRSRRPLCFLAFRRSWPSEVARLARILSSAPISVSFCDSGNALFGFVEGAAAAVAFRFSSSCFFLWLSVLAF